MPLVPLPAPVVRRAEVVELLRRIHIAPSHRRMPHHTWKDALSLVMDLLLGFGKRRYFNGQGVATGNKGEHKGVLGR